MDHGIGERYYFVTIGLTTGKAKICSKEDIQIRYGTFLLVTALFLSYILIRDMSIQAVGFVICMLIIILPLLYLSFASGRDEARKYIERHRLELDDKRP